MSRPDPTGVSADMTGELEELARRYESHAAAFRSKFPWWRRLWILVSNPVLYVVRGEVRW